MGIHAAAQGACPRDLHRPRAGGGRFLWPARRCPRRGRGKGERHCRIQVASFKDDRNAGATLERLRLSGLTAVIETSGAYRRVVFPTVAEKDAEALAARLRALGNIDLLVTWY